MMELCANHQFIRKNKWANQRFHKLRNKIQYASKHYGKSLLITKRKDPTKQRKDRKKFKIQRKRKKISKQLAFDYQDFLYQNKNENHKRIQMSRSLNYTLKHDISDTYDYYYDKSWNVVIWDNKKAIHGAEKKMNESDRLLDGIDDDRISVHIWAKLYALFNKIKKIISQKKKIQKMHKKLCNHCNVYNFCFDEINSIILKMKNIRKLYDLLQDTKHAYGKIGVFMYDKLCESSFDEIDQILFNTKFRTIFREMRDLLQYIKRDEIGNVIYNCNDGTLCELSFNELKQIKIKDIRKMFEDKTYKTCDVSTCTWSDWTWHIYYEILVISFIQESYCSDNMDVIYQNWKAVNASVLNTKESEYFPEICDEFMGNADIIISIVLPKMTLLVNGYMRENLENLDLFMSQCLVSFIGECCECAISLKAKIQDLVEHQINLIGQQMKNCDNIFDPAIFTIYLQHSSWLGNIMADMKIKIATVEELYGHKGLLAELYGY